MRSLDLRDIDRIREIQSALRTLIDGGPPALDSFIPALGDALGVDRLLGYVLAPRGDGLRLEHAVQRGLPANAIALFDDWLSDKMVGWAAYNPIRPEPDQRNRVLCFDPIGTERGLEATPVMREILPRMGLDRCQRMRVVLCDGPSMLAWVGAFRDEPWDDRQLAIVEELIPSIQRRLKIERTIATADINKAVDDVLFDAISAAAFLVGAGGEVYHANAAGREMLDRDASARASLRDAARGENSAFDATKVPLPNGSTRYLVLHRASAEARTTARAETASQRWGLTRRQRDVLLLLVRGMSNRTIAATLGMAEKTVEVHLTAVFEKAQVGSRAALVAKVLSS